MESDSVPVGQAGEQGISPLPEVLAGAEPEARHAITQVIALHSEFPAWAVWLPHRGGPWTAVRPASARAPAPEVPMIWVHALTAPELADRMRRADAQLTPP